MSYNIGDSVEFRKQYGIKGLKSYETFFKPGKIQNINKSGNFTKIIIEDEKGVCHRVTSRQIRPVVEISNKW